MNEPNSVPSFYIPKLKHRTYGISLYKEATAIRPNMVYQCFNEQRRYPRFKPDTKIFILHATQGTVDDISIGGLSYIYHQLPKEATQPLPDASTLFSAEKDYLFDIPCTVISDSVIKKSYSFFPELRLRRIRFDELTAQQLQGLEKFILTHAVVTTYEEQQATPTASPKQFGHTS